MVEKYSKFAGEGYRLSRVASSGKLSMAVCLLDLIETTFVLSELPCLRTCGIGIGGGSPQPLLFSFLFILILFLPWRTR
ncbi:unnamed protein product [Coffea canephora]|uniref:Uncharacterized protein n=1 Tax=Coffea canephora TaxID=49390 RepID=A0A068U162_COFCA|nr:unnamed protein product [Coffea canephora]